MFMLADSGNMQFPESFSGKLSATDCSRLVAGVTDNPASLALVRDAREQLIREGGEFQGDDFERALLRLAATTTESRIGGLPVHESVRQRVREEFRFYTQPPSATGSRNSFGAGSHLFATGCKILSLRRFPAGPMDWEIDGIPRSWLGRVPKRDLARVGLFIATKLGGFHPLFFMHVARRPKNRSLLIEREVRRAYVRMALSLELQPSVKGIMADAWFLDPAAVETEPHLACLTRPYLEGGGLITTLGPADADAGFLEHNAERREQLNAGQLRYQLGLALWPRRQAIDWARAHAEPEV